MSTSPLGEEREERERRLEEIRRKAHQQALIPFPEAGRGTSFEASPETGYYGVPLLKRPQWTVEIPIYFFVGGAAGAAAVIAAVGEITRQDEALIRDARWLAAIGGMISPALLISDLGMPSRFLAMLRVFKVQSPMSVGSWTLVAFSNSAVASAVLGELQRRRTAAGVPVLRRSSQIAAALTGLVLATYTGVLIGATAIPVWNEHISSLPIHFAVSGMLTAASVLELRGHDSEALNKIGMLAATLETLMGASIEFFWTPAKEPLRHGVSGKAMRGAGLLSGPVPLAFRILSLLARNNRRGLRRAAAISSVLGSLLTRWAWVQAGRASADDPRVPLELESPVYGELEGQR
jgi:Polysulphide reductase, NrfD